MVGFAINAAPTLFLLGRDGRIVATNPSEPELEEAVTRLLADASRSSRN